MLAVVASPPSLEAPTLALTVEQPGVGEAEITAVVEDRDSAVVHWLAKPNHEINGTLTPPASEPQFRDSWVPPSEEDFDNCQLEPHP